MASGSHGLCGQAVLKPVAGVVSRETGFVMDPFLEGSPVLENKKRCGAVMRRDAQVSGWEHSLLCQQYFIKNRKPELLRNGFFCGFFSFNSCIKLVYFPFVSRTSRDMWRGQLFQCCMEDDSSRGYSSSTLSSQCHG